MSNLRSSKRKLNPTKVWLATQVAEEKVKIARQVVIEQAKKDATFAAEILKAVKGDNLHPEVKTACEESVAHARATDDGNPLVGGDTSHELTEAIQLDGGGVIMVRPEEVPGHSTDGEKIVMMEGPKLEKA